LLEEPPAHVRFIFATTEVDKVLPTVLSRCQRFDFRSIALEDIVSSLRVIAANEKAALSDALLYRVARAAGGGMRDAQTLLDQLIAVSSGAGNEKGAGNETGAGSEKGGVNESDLNLLLGAARGEDLTTMVTQLLAGEAGPALEGLERTAAAGVAPATLLDQMVDHVRAMLLLQACGKDSPALRRLGADVATVTAHAAACTAEKTLRICQLLMGSQQALRQGVDPRLQLELVFVRIAGLGQLVDVENLLRKIERLEPAASGSPARP
jgi:DNA polymerase-3 subunit gamma/tau